MNIRLIAAVVIAAGASLLAGCGGGGGGIGGTGSPEGTMRLSITDAPSCGYDEVNITIDRVRVHKSSSAVDADSGWSEVVLTPGQARRSAELDERRARGARPDRTARRQVHADAPRARAQHRQQPVRQFGRADRRRRDRARRRRAASKAGIKLNVDIDIAADKVADFVLDFDACKSVVKRGNSGQYNLKPVIAVIPIVSDAGCASSASSTRRSR